uniref:Uncharacterized protein n=1 Tax=Panagrolaimus sp. PS1159 TaxID=55785 RepID=A0AC35FUP8_9BILA
MEKKIIIEQLMDKEDGLKYSNYNIIIFVKEFERTLQMITEAIFQLEEAVKKFKSLGNVEDEICVVKNLLENGNNLSKRKAEKIRRQIEHCQEIIDSFEIVCNNLTAHLSELAAISGDSVISQEADYLIELQDFKFNLQNIRQKFVKPKNCIKLAV